MAISVSVQYDGGSLLDIILLTQYPPHDVHARKVYTCRCVHIFLQAFTTSQNVALDISKYSMYLVANQELFCRHARLAPNVLTSEMFERDQINASVAALQIKATTST